MRYTTVVLVKSAVYWDSLPFGEVLRIRTGIHLRIYKDSPNSTEDPEFQGMNRTPFFDPKKGVPYQRLSPQSGSDASVSESKGILFID